MGSTTFHGVMCTDCNSLYLEGVLDSPCPHCGSRRRTFLQSLGGEIKPEGTVDWLRTDQKKRVLGYGDTGRHGTTRHGNLETDDTISLIIEGKPPRNEEDTGRVCRTLAAAMSGSGEHFTAVVTGERDVDAELRSPSRVLRVQVVKALSEMQFWRKLALSLKISQRLSISEAVAMLATALTHKAAFLPVAQRQQLVLALDADRVPALAIEPVPLAFRATQAASVAALGFHQAWLVGPDPRLTWRLDAWCVLCSKVPASPT